MHMNLDYITQIFSNPLERYKRLLEQMEKRDDRIQVLVKPTVQSL